MIKSKASKIAKGWVVAARISIIYALAAGVWIFASDILLAWFAHYPQHLATLQTYKGFLFIGVTALLLYGLMGNALTGLTAQQPPESEVGDALQSENETTFFSLWREARTPILIFLLLASAIGATGYLVYGYLKASLEQQKQAELSAIADNKVNEINHWLTERRKDAELMIHNPFLAAEVKRWFSAGAMNDDSKDRLLAWLSNLKQAFDYSALMLTDEQGQVRLGVGASHIHPKRQALVLQALQSGQVVLSDLHRRQEIPEGIIDIDLIVPLGGGLTEHGQPVGALFFKIDPEQYLFPLIQEWPTPSPSAETLLVRREGDDVVYLNELRHRKNTALQLRLPISNEHLPTARAVKGQLGVSESTDYRQVRVLTVARQVPGTAWFMIAKVDLDEVYAPIQNLMLLVTTLVSVFITAAGAGTGLWWRQQRARFVAEHYRDKLERQALIQHFDYIAKYANDIILLMDGQGHIVEANARAISAYSYSREELLNLNVCHLCDRGTEIGIIGQMPQIESTDGLVFEAIHVRKDKSRFPVEVSSRLIAIEGQEFLHCIVRDVSERKQAEETLRNNQALLQAVIEGTSDTIYVKDLQGRYLLFNSAASQITGKSAAEVLGKDDTFVFAPDEARQVMADDRRVLDSKAVLTYEETITAASGEKRTYLSIKGIIFDEQGKAFGLFGIARDITERKQAEEALNFYRFLVDTISDPIYVISPAQGFRLIQANKAACQHYGWSQEKLLTTSIPDWNPDFTPEVCQQFWERLKAERFILFETAHRSSDGRIIPVEISANYLVYDHQEYLAGFFHDITKRKQTETALKRSEAHLRAIVNAVPDILLVLDAEGRYLDILTAQPLLYTDPAALKGKRVSEVMPAAIAERILAAIQRALLTRQPQRVEYELPIRKAGRRFFEARLAPIEAPDSAKPAVVAVARDLTERKLTEEKLRQAQKMEAIGQLTGGVAHDFNNLLAIILANLELLEEELTDQPALQDLIRRAFDAVDRGANLTRRLLAFSRRQPLQSKPTNLNTLVTEMADLLRRTLGETIHVQTLLAADLQPTLIDPIEFENALLNLALNARDAMPAGGQLTIETANQWLDEDYGAGQRYFVRPGWYVMLAMSDTGAGMTPEVIEHAFEPFFTTKDVGKGSGLGLSMVYGLVKQSSGYINLYSEVNKGTTIRVYLPQATLETASLAEAHDSEAALHQGHGETILVVEDDANVRKLTISMLNSLGYRTVEADQAQTALQKLEETPQIALLFTDIVLPGGMNGADLASEAQRRRPNLKVLFTSGYPKQILADHIGLQDSGEFIAKPYHRANLANKLRVALDNTLH